MSARIHTSIAADTPEEYFEALRALLYGEGRFTTKAVQEFPSAVEYDVIDAEPEIEEAKGVVALPEVKEAQKTENVRVAAALDAAINPELDAHGHPWSAELHASTKGKTQDGLWRMGRGKERPAPMPGYPKVEDAGSQPGQEGAAQSDAGTSSSAAPSEPVPVAEPASAEDDEFAAFARANAESEKPTAPTEPPIRVWSDADLSKLNNEAARKLNGNIGPIKEIISRYVPAGQTDHSRNIPVEDREAFAQEIEKLAEFTFAG